LSHVFFTWAKSRTESHFKISS